MLQIVSTNQTLAALPWYFMSALWRNPPTTAVSVLPSSPALSDIASNRLSASELQGCSTGWADRELASGQNARLRRRSWTRIKIRVSHLQALAVDKRHACSSLAVLISPSRQGYHNVPSSPRQCSLLLLRTNCVEQASRVRATMLLDRVSRPRASIQPECETEKERLDKNKEDDAVLPAKVHLSKQAIGLIFLSHPWNISASNYCMCLSTWSDKTLIGQSADKAIDLVALVLLGLQYFLEICFSTRGTGNNNFKKEIFFQQQVASIFILHSWFYSVSSFNHLQWINQRLINRPTHLSSRLKS